MSGAYLVPALVVLGVLLCLHARRDAYGAFVRGAREGLETALQTAPYLCAVFSATALLRDTGMMDALEGLLAPLLARAALPAQALGVVLLRPLSGSAALAAVADVLRETGADSRAGRLCCVISGAGETVFFTGALYLGAAGVRHARYAVPAALCAYAALVLTAALIVR